MKWVQITTDEDFEKRPLIIPGDKLVGIYLGIDKFEGEYGESYIAKIGDIEDPDKEYTIFPNVVLKNRLKNANVGDIVKITYLGMRQSNKSSYQYKDFKVITIKE